MHLSLRILLLLALAACGSATPFPSPPPRPTSTLPPTVTRAGASRTPSATPSVTRTPRATATATRTATVSATPRIVVETGRLAPGFSLTTYAHVPAPTSLSFGPDERLYVASTNGVVYVVGEAKGASELYARDVPVPVGLAWVDERLYISYRGSVKYVEDTDGDGVSDGGQVVVRGLPSFGLHQNDGLALGTDGFLYMGMGSTCDHCREADPRNGTILRFRPDGSALSVYASGLRNPYDVAFNTSGDLFATDNSRDDLGPDQPPEELNHIRAGQHFGWPDCWLGNTAPLCAERANPVAAFSAHTSANGLVFYHGRQFPEVYFDNAFVAILGSIYMFPLETERGIMRVRLTPQGESYAGEGEWFLELPEGRPVDLTVGPDGGLYVADYAAGAVYRIVYGEP
jgi:glucose/arabinose dehydrogenase